MVLFDYGFRLAFDIILGYFSDIYHNEIRITGLPSAFFK